MSYDFFISFASGDSNEAQELAFELEGLGRNHFLSSATINAGDQWDKTVVEALSESRVVVILVSPNTDKAFYQLEEVARAIQALRDNPDAHSVVPVLLAAAKDADIPFGLKIINNLAVTEQSGMKRIAFILNQDFSSEVPSKKQRQNAYYGLGASHRLDRTSQWLDVLMSGQTGTNTFFLLRGSKTQNVELFLDRIERFLAQESTNPREVCRIRYNLQGQTPRTGSDWVAHFCEGLGIDGNSVSQTLKTRIGRKQIFAIIGEKPLPIELMSNDQFDAIGELLRENLPEIVNEAGLDTGIDILLPFHYDREMTERFNLLDLWGQTLEQQTKGAFYFNHLAEIPTPTWEDVARFLNTHRPLPNENQIEMIRTEFEERAKDPRMTFIELAMILDDVLMNG